MAGSKRAFRDADPWGGAGVITQKRPGLASMLAVYRREVAFVSHDADRLRVRRGVPVRHRVVHLPGRAACLTRAAADLLPFFGFHPWLFMVFLPAVAMRLWSEESALEARIELLLTLPAPTWCAGARQIPGGVDRGGRRVAADIPALGHGQRAWAIARQRARSSPAYLTSLLMAGAYLAIGSAMSALTPAQVVAFVLAVMIVVPADGAWAAAGVGLLLRLRRRRGGGGDLALLDPLSLRRGPARRGRVPLDLLLPVS